MDQQQPYRTTSSQPIERNLLFKSDSLFCLRGPREIRDLFNGKLQRQVGADS